MFNRFPLFRKWVPEWLMKVIMFMQLLPSIVIFFLPLANINAGAGYYGCEPSDIQFSVALFYSGYVGFYVLERRFFSYLAAKEYFLLFTCLNMATMFICYMTNDLYVFFSIRFIQGMLFSSIVNLSLSVLFTRLKSERAREISFSIFFGFLICALPFNNLVTADLIDAFDFNIVYKFALYSYVPGTILLNLSMNNIRLDKKFPLKRLDWQSFALYSMILILIGYVLIFGQEFYWFSDFRIRASVATITFLIFIYYIRQKSMKRPYIDLSVLQYKNFLLGLLLLFILYICRFASGISNTYFLTVLKLDHIHLSYINAFNMAGLIVGTFLSCIFILQKRSIRLILILGFSALLFFYISMLYIFTPESNENNFYIPLFVQGFGVGMLMVPIILFAITSVPAAAGAAASALCLATRFLSFCASIAILNFYELYSKGRHYSAFQDKLTADNPVVKDMLRIQTNKLVAHGMDRAQAVKGAEKTLVTNLNHQSHIRFGIDYFEIMSWVILATLIVIAFFPYINRTVVQLKSKDLAPA